VRQDNWRFPTEGASPPWITFIKMMHVQHTKKNVPWLVFQNTCNEYLRAEQVIIGEQDDDETQLPDEDSSSDSDCVRAGDSSEDEKTSSEEGEGESSSEEEVVVKKTPTKKTPKKAVAKKADPKPVKKPTITKQKEGAKRVRGKAKKELPKITQGSKGSKNTPLEVIDAQESMDILTKDRSRLWKRGRVVWMDPDTLQHASLEVNQREYSETYAHQLERDFLKKGFYEASRFHCTIYLEDVAVVDETAESVILASPNRMCIAGNHSFKAAQFCKASLMGMGAQNSFLTIPVQVLNKCSKHEILKFSIRHNDKGALFKPQSMMDRAKIFRRAFKNPEKFDTTEDLWKEGAVDTVYQDKTMTAYVRISLYYIFLRLSACFYFVFFVSNNKLIFRK
jgi:hypothetical protein